MSWNLFIDDERMPPNDGRRWIIARNMAQVQMLVHDLGMPAFVSFDHDLGENQPTGFDIAKYLVATDMDAMTPDQQFTPMFQYAIHSQNPIGGGNIAGLLNGYLRHRFYG